MSGINNFQPIRPLSEFVLDPSKYLKPPFSDVKGLNRRVVSNLLYFQTNYMILSSIVFLIFLILTGSLGIATTALIGLFALDKIPQASSIRAQYPVAVIASAVVALLVLYVSFKSIVFVLIAILLPIVITLIHSATRSRNIKNKAANKIEKSGIITVYEGSPMTALLNLLGFDTKNVDE